MLKVGLTGGIGSGKSTVCEMFAACNVPVIDADSIAHEVTQQGQSGYEAIVRRFGNSVLLENGELDRPLLRSMIFADINLKRDLENLLHPLIFAEIDRQTGNMNADYCIISIPLLVETGNRQMLDRVVVIDAADNLRLERATGRDNTTHEEIRKIMAAQASRSRRLEMADDVINNDGDLDSLRAQVMKLHNLYKHTATELR